MSLKDIFLGTFATVANDRAKYPVNLADLNFATLGFGLDRFLVKIPINLKISTNISFLAEFLPLVSKKLPKKPPQGNLSMVKKVHKMQLSLKHS